MLVEDRNMDITIYPARASIAVEKELAVPLNGRG